MAAETMALADPFDSAFSLKCDLTSILRRPLPLLVLTDSKPLFDVLTNSKYTTEKRLMIELSAAREGFNRHEITNICLIKSEDNIADSMTKLSSNNSLHRLLTLHMIDPKILQYVVDPATPSANKDKKTNAKVYKSS
jgi:hypothetical protein